MKKDNVSIIEVATKDTIFGSGVSSKKEIIDRIQNNDRRKILISIGYLLNNINLEYVYRKRMAVSKPYRLEIRKQFMHYMLYSKQGLLLLAKWVVCYGIEKDYDFNIEIDDSIIDETLWLQLMLADYLQSDDIYSNISYLFKNFSLNSKRNIKNDIARSYRIFAELSRQKELYKAKEYVDIYKDYSSEYKHTITEYLSVLFPILCIHIQKSDDKKAPVINVKSFSENIKARDVFLEVLKSKTSSIDELKEWCETTIDNTWDYSQLLTKPFISLGGQFILWLHEDFIINQFFESLFYKIREIYPKEDKQILSFMGRPFEKYVGELAKNAVNESIRDAYNYIEEFEYGKDKKDSSDAYILSGDKLIIIEAKSKRPIFSTYYSNDDKKLIKEIRKVTIEPVNQAIDAYEAIMKSKERKIFSGVNEIYIISVSLLGAPRISEVQTYVDNEIKKNLGASLKGYCNLNIEEFEYFCGMFRNDVNIFKLIEDYTSKQSYSPFVNYINDKGYNNSNSNFLTDNYIKFTKEAQNILFENE